MELKPSNVLVTEQDGMPVPKIIDFGVAKATSQRLTERTLFTEQGLLIGTPEYMSPEQANLNAHDVDAATDIYSLGVLLYELIVGALPFDSRQLRRAGYFALLQAIREQDPPSLTGRLKTLGATASDVATRRQTDLHALEKQLQGELEWITMRALEKDRTRRYASASEFAAEIQRHLNDEPVLAGPPSRVYRLKKLARRHRGAVFAVSTIVVLVLAGLVASTVLYVRERRQRDIAERQSYVANLASADALIEANDYAGARERLFQCVPRLRGWEWRMLYGLADTSLAALRGTGDPFEQRFPPMKFAFSRDGKRIFFNMVRTVHAWYGPPTWQPAGDNRVPGVILALSQDGTKVVTLSLEKASPELTVMEPTSGRRVVVLGGHPDASVAAFSSDGTIVAAVSVADGIVRIWDAASGVPRATGSMLVSKSSTLLPVLHFSPDNKYLACGSQGLQILEVRGGKTVRDLQVDAQGTTVTALAFSPNSKRISAVDNVGGVWTWDLTTASPPRVISDTGMLSALAFSPDGTRMVTAGVTRAVRLWDANTGSLLATLTGNVAQAPNSVAFTPDGNWILAGSATGEVWIWDARTVGGSVLAQMAFPAFAPSPDGHSLAAAIGESTAILESATGGTLLRCAGSPCSVAFSGAGDRLATGTREGHVVVIDPHTCGQVLSWKAHEGAVQSLAFSPDGRYLASGSADHTARLWDAVTAKQLAEIALPGRFRKEVAFSPDGRFIATADIDDGGAGHSLWEIPSARLFLSFARHSAFPSYSPTLAFSPDGKQMVSNDYFNLVRVSSTTTGEVTAILKAHTSVALAVAFSPDGRRIASAGLDNTIRFWDAERHELLFTLRRSGITIYQLTFSPDGNRLYAAGWDRAFQGKVVLRVWDAGRASTSRARELIAQLSRRYPLMMDVRRQLEIDPSLDESLRSAAVRICWPAQDLIGPLTEQLLIPALNPSARLADFKEALQRGETFRRLWPHSTMAPLYLGAAQYRNKLYEEAVSNLSQAADAEDAVAEAFLAMALHRIGRTESAHRSLTRARVYNLSAKDPSERRIASPLIAEAEALLSEKTK